MDGVVGDVKMRPYVGWIHLDSFSEATNRQPTSGASSVGKTALQGYRFTKPPDGASTGLLRFSQSNQAIHTAELQVVRSGKVILTIKLYDVHITSMLWSRGHESVEVEFERFSITGQKEPVSDAAEIGWRY